MEDLTLLAQAKLTAMGVKTEYDIENSIEYYVNLATAELTRMLGVKSLPYGSEDILLDMLVGLFLRDVLIKEDRTVSYASSIKEGEVTVAYDGGKSLWDIANEMTKPSEYKLSAFRCIKW